MKNTSDNSKYKQWIQEHYPTPQSARSMCEEAVVDMTIAFPELDRVRGEIEVVEPYDLLPTKTTHWWCVTKDNTIIDPTGHQYPTQILKYTPVDSTKGTPTGKCMNCGSITYNGSYTCCEACEKEIRQSFS